MVVLSAWRLALPALAAAVLRRGSNPASTALQEIQHRVDADGEADQAAYQKLECWCKATLSQEERAADDTRQELSRLSHDLEAEGAHNQQLSIQLKRNQEELDSNMHSLNTAKAMRERDAKQFGEEERTHVQSIQDLGGALEALGRGRLPRLDLNQLVSSLKRKMPAGPQHAALLQLERRLAAASSPDVVYGVVGQLKDSMSEQLEKLRHSEAAAKERHDGLVSAKSMEIRALQKQIAEEKRRLAEGKVSVSSKKEQIEKGQKLLESSGELLQAVRKLCKDSADAYEERRQARQAETLAIANAQAALAGTQLLTLRGASRSSRASRGGGVAVCSAAREIPEEPWRSRAKSACELAQSGSVKQASDAVESLEEDLKEAQATAERENEECEAATREVLQEASMAAKAASAEAGVVDSDRAEADARIRDLQAEDAAAAKAKEQLASLGSAERAVMQELRVSVTNAGELLKRASLSASGSAASNIHEAMGQSDRLLAAFSSFDQALAADAQHVAALLDNVRRAAGSALIPLRELRANSEEAALALQREDRERSSRAATAGVHCEARKLRERAERLEGYVRRLGEASEALAYDLLR